MVEPPFGQLVIISGPSGSGKTTVVRELLQRCGDLPLELSVSATTRPSRPGETHGVDYHFLSLEEFQQSQAEGKFLEWCEVFGRGHLYGTLAEPVYTSRQAGKWVILEIDVEGAMKVVEELPDAVTIFVHPGSMEELAQRLRGRGTESESAIQRRLEVARRELEFSKRYRHCVVNDEVGATVDKLNTILNRYRTNPSPPN